MEINRLDHSSYKTYNQITDEIIADESYNEKDASLIGCRNHELPDESNIQISTLKKGLNKFH